MTPVIRHLQNNFLVLPPWVESESLQWVFDREVQDISSERYQAITPLHPVLNVEYSILCQQIKHNFLFPEQLTKQQMIERLVAALILCELLEHMSRCYLNVPREVVRLRRHQQLYREMLTELEGYSFTDQPVIEQNPSMMFAQRIREYTSNTNWYRLFLGRCNRAINILDTFGTHSATFHRFVATIEPYTAPFFANLGWVFFLPRLSVNFFLMLKHTLPGSWLTKEEQAMAWSTRLQIQIQRRWFDLSNDMVWVAITLLNNLVFTGTPVAIGLSITAFAFDVVCAAIRAYIELNRLYQLRTEYTKMCVGAHPDRSNEILEYQGHMDQRIHFEQMRLGLSVVNTSAVLAANILLLPIFAFNPAFPLTGAALLIVLGLSTFVLNRVIERYRPQEAIEKPSNLSTLGFFAGRNDERRTSVDLDDDFLPAVRTTYCH